MTMQIMPTEIIKLWKPEFVAPSNTSHESVPVSGEIFEAGGDGTLKFSGPEARVS